MKETALFASAKNLDETSGWRRLLRRLFGGKKAGYNTEGLSMGYREKPAYHRRPPVIQHPHSYDRGADLRRDSPRPGESIGHPHLYPAHNMGADLSPPDHHSSIVNQQSQPTHNMEADLSIPYLDHRRSVESGTVFIGGPSSNRIPKHNSEFFNDRIPSIDAEFF